MGLGRGDVQPCPVLFWSCHLFLDVHFPNCLQFSFERAERIVTAGRADTGGENPVGILIASMHTCMRDGEWSEEHTSPLSPTITLGSVKGIAMYGVSVALHCTAPRLLRYGGA